MGVIILLVFLLMFKLLSCKMFVLCCHFIFSCYLLIFFYWIYRKQKRKSYKFDLSSFYILWYGWNNFYVYVFLYICACIKLYALNMCVMFQYLKWLYGSILLFHDLPKRGSEKILARSSIFSESNIKVDFKVTASR